MADSLERAHRRNATWDVVVAPTVDDLAAGLHIAAARSDHCHAQHLE